MKASWDYGNNDIVSQINCTTKCIKKFLVSNFIGLGAMGLWKVYDFSLPLL